MDGRPGCSSIRTFPSCSVEPRALVQLLAAALLLVSLYVPAIQRIVNLPLCFPALSRLVEIVVLAPLLEEILFRGVLWAEIDAVAGSMHPFAVLVTSTALLFGAWHLPLMGSVNLIGHILFGVAMALVRNGSGTLLPCVLLHATGNILTGVAYEGHCRP
jgi:membrane protease YdiL (CAAX protease family)